MYDTFRFPFSFERPENKAMARKVLGEVQSVYGIEKWKKAGIKGKAIMMMVIIVIVMILIIIIIIIIIINHYQCNTNSASTVKDGPTPLNNEVTKIIQATRPILTSVITNPGDFDNRVSDTRTRKRPTIGDITDITEWRHRCVNEGEQWVQ